MSYYANQAKKRAELNDRAQYMPSPAPSTGSEMSTPRMRLRWSPAASPSPTSDLCTPSSVASSGLPDLAGVTADRERQRRLETQRRVREKKNLQQRLEEEEQSRRDNALAARKKNQNKLTYLPRNASGTKPPKPPVSSAQPSRPPLPVTSNSRIPVLAQRKTQATSTGSDSSPAHNVGAAAPSLQPACDTALCSARAFEHVTLAQMRQRYQTAAVDSSTTAADAATADSTAATTAATTAGLTDSLEGSMDQSLILPQDDDCYVYGKKGEVWDARGRVVTSAPGLPLPQPSVANAPPQRTRPAKSTNAVPPAHEPEGVKPYTALEDARDRLVAAVREQFALELAQRDCGSATPPPSHLLSGHTNHTAAGPRARAPIVSWSPHTGTAAAVTGDDYSESSPGCGGAVSRNLLEESFWRDSVDGMHSDDGEQNECNAVCRSPARVTLADDPLNGTLGRRRWAKGSVSLLDSLDLSAPNVSFDAVPATASPATVSAAAETTASRARPTRSPPHDSILSNQPSLLPKAARHREVISNAHKLADKAVPGKQQHKQERTPVSVQKRPAKAQPPSKVPSGPAKTKAGPTSKPQARPGLGVASSRTGTSKKTIPCAVRESLEVFNRVESLANQSGFTVDQIWDALEGDDASPDPPQQTAVGDTTLGLAAAEEALLRSINLLDQRLQMKALAMPAGRSGL